MTFCRAALILSLGAQWVYDFESNEKLKMSRKQWAVLLTGIILFSLSELFPPWLYEDENTSAVRPAGYHFINNPPKVKSPDEMKKIFSLREDAPTQFIWVHKDRLRSDGQRAFLLFLTLGLWLVLFGRRVILGLVTGIISLCIGLTFFGLYIWYISIFWQ
jgi:hypothetical protein